MNLVYRYRVKSLNGLLNAQARAVSFVWNYCNDRQKDAIKWNKKWLSGFDLNYLTAGSSKELGIPSSTINQVCQQYAKSRFQHRRPWLRYRGRKSLGWVPVKGADLKRHGDAFRFYGRTYRVFNSRTLPPGKITDGTNFSRDARGNWYLNVAIEVAEAPKRPAGRGVGIDLGLKDLATLSTGEKIENPRHYRELEKRLGVAQRARKRRATAKIGAKIANRRKDYLHKVSTRIVRDFDFIACGNVNAAGLAKTSMAKSVKDASWSGFRKMLAYKSVRDGARYEEVSEAFSTQVCSACGSKSGPKGATDLGIREWSCGECGAVHDRDCNAAVNLLLRSGYRAPAEGTLAA